MFLTHVELREAQPADYQQLHAYMEDAGFSRTFRTDSGAVYQLPSFQYFGGSKDIASTVNAAKAAAAKTGKTFSVMTADTASIRFDGLNTVS